MKIKLFLLFFTLSLNIFSNELSPYIIITEEWPPYNYVEKNQIKGFSFEIVKYIMEDLNITSKILITSALRAEQILKTNSRVIYFTLFRTPERENSFKWIGPINKDGIYFYKNKNSSLNINTLEDAKNTISISCRHHGLVYNHLLKNGFTNLDTSTKNKSIYQKVLLGRTSLAIGETDLGVAYILKQLNIPIDTLEKTNVKLFHYNLYIAATKDISDSEIELWQNSFDKMKQSGKYNKLYKKYMSQSN